MPQGKHQEHNLLCPQADGRTTKENPMITVEDKQTRMALAQRYMDADTSIHEELMLARYYASHPIVDSDEEQIASLIRIVHSETDAMLQLDSSEFDRIVSKHAKPASKSLILIRWSVAAAAAVLLLLVCLRHTRPAVEPVQTQDPTLAFSPAQILEGMEMLSKIEVGEIESVLAQPTGSTVLITIKLKSGKESTYLMSTDDGGNSLSFMSLN